MAFGTGYAIGGWLISSGDGKEGHTLCFALSSSLAGSKFFIKLFILNSNGQKILQI